MAPRTASPGLLVPEVACMRGMRVPRWVGRHQGRLLLAQCIGGGGCGDMFPGAQLPAQQGSRYAKQ